ncbi:MAG: YfhO family protein [Caldilineaceae bacterium]|nr:YfhO family protein [Caldilineaceae bacterium]
MAPRHPRRWRVDFLIALALALFVLLLFYRLLFTNRVLASGDILLYFYPYRDYAADALRHGRVPLWNPYSFLGVPFLANPQSAVLYPLHWPLSWLPVTKQIYWSAAMHAWLLGMGGYLLMRRWGYGAGAGLITGVTLCGSGFYGGLIGHINQMNGAAWLPWLVLIYDASTSLSTSLRFTIQELATVRELQERQSGALDGMVGIGRRFWRARGFYEQVVGLSAVIALMLLAGHTQTAYINLFGLGIWAVALPLARRSVGKVSKLAHPTILWNSRLWWALGERLVLYVGSVVLALWIAAAQLLPTLELSNLGLRSGGLSYAEATSFSLKPLQLLWTLFPSYGLADLGVVFGTSGYTEFVAYVGLIGLLLALLGVWKGAWRGGVEATPRGWLFGLLFVGLGLFLAAGRWNPFYFLLYKFVPGFDLFRTPARWMMLYTMGAAVLAGVGAEWMLSKIGGAGQSEGRWWRQRTWAWTAFLMGLVALDLLLAANALPHTQPTAPEAVAGVRTGPAHLLTDPARARVGPAAMGRFLSMSNTRFDPGDMADLQAIFVDGGDGPFRLDQRAFDQLIVALKEQEILAPNLALLWRVPSVDGFDGGVLPLQRYIHALSLFVPPDQVVPDGRLREQLRQVPSTSLLNFLNIQYVMTDKVRDLWVDDIYYDRQIGAKLDVAQPTTVVNVPQPLEATRLDLIGYLEGDASALRMLAADTAVARVQVHGADTTQTFSIVAGVDWADGALDSPLAASRGAQIALRDVDGGRQEYIVRLAFDAPMTPQEIEVQLTAQFQQDLAALAAVLQAATLVDERTGAFVPLLPSDRGHFQRVHSGDVKIYENLDVLPRAYLVHQSLSATDEQEALALVEEHAAELDRVVILEGAPPFVATAHADDAVEMIAYAPERVELRAHSQEAARLVLSDSYYPGWRAWVDGAETPIYAANYLARGIELPAGDHTVVFAYAPASWRRGVQWSMAGLLIWLGLLFSVAVLQVKFK